ncbi:MAG: hypothetical protein U1E28_10980 [Beijerinckiaceae bacterium]
MTETDSASRLSPGDTDDAVSAALLRTVLRATDALRNETEQLRCNMRPDLARHRREKDMTLLDLTRQGKLLGDRDPGPQVRAALARLKEAVIENQAALRIQLKAARQITKILVDVVMDAESDRTYDRRHVSRYPS